jgi:uncharacterized protein
MDIKSVFYNQERFSIRAGWRIVIFLLISIACGFPILTLLKFIAEKIPLIKMQSVGMFFAYFALTLSTWIALRYIDKRPFVSVGLSFKGNFGKELSQGLGLGFGMMSLIFVFEYSMGWVVIEYRNLGTGEWITIFSNSLFLYIVVGYGEEFLFRGYILQALTEGSNKIIAIFAFSILFGFAHEKNPNVTPFAIANIVLAGIWLTVAYYKTNALWLSIGMHFSWNFTQGFIFSFPVSGTTSVKEQIGTAVVTGPNWITGGSFGPEGGVLATIIILSGTALIYFSPWFFASEKTWRVDSWLADKKEQQQNLESQNPIEII